MARFLAMSRSSRRRSFALGLVAVAAGIGLTSCEPATSTLSRPSAPMVLTGAQLPALVGTAPARIVAFRLNQVENAPVWTQIPVQVDQRKVVGFGSQPPSNATAGVAGTVYGHGSPGPTALQYADPNTFVGADGNPNFDADDELVFMVGDGGGQAKLTDETEPAGVIGGSGVAVRLDDSRDGGTAGWAYLFRTNGGLDPSAGEDYVDYDFTLTSGDYKTTYKRNDGPNVETSKVVTPTYEAAFTDRWKETSWKVTAGSATGVDVLDGHKNQFGTGSCGRSNATFAEEEGAFVANIDGPVRAIRSYVGANSGPRTQRTHLMYRDREDVITDLRVHAIPEIMDFVDYSSAAVGMTYRSSTKPAGVPIDGVADAISTAVPTWEAIEGAQGRIFTRSTFTSSVSSLGANTTEFYRDKVSPVPSEPQCWGDGSFYAASGTHIRGGIPNTDPGASPTATLRATRVTQFAAPLADDSKITPYAADWSADLATPLKVTVSRYQP